MGAAPRVCAFNGMPCHHELIGHVLAFRADLPVFSTPGDARERWFELYAALFPGARIRPVGEYAPQDWDVTLLLTDDDGGFPAGVPACRVVCVDHWHEVRRAGDFRRRLATRHFSARLPPVEWVMPVYGVHALPEKRAAALDRADGRVQVACIGDSLNQVLPPWTLCDALRARFSNAATGIRWHLFRRRDAGRDGGGLDLVQHPNASACEMAAALLGCDYVLLLAHTACERNYARTNMSGAVPLAFATGCRLIMTEEARREHALESPLAVEADEGAELARPAPADLERVYREAAALCDRRDRLLGEALGLRPA
jgi:hypothetical protein